MIQTKVKLLFKKYFNKRIFSSKIFRISIFVLVLYSTFVLRAHNYDRTPGAGHLEEMMYGWAGMYLIETGVPVSWSSLDYPDRAEVFRGAISYQGNQPIVHVRLYKPWMDEPPLFSLIVGEVSHLYNASRTDVIPSSYLRLITVLLAAVSSIFIFLVARFVAGYWTGILAMLLYGTIPILVDSSRMAVPENLIAMFFIITVFLLLKFLQKPNFLYLLPIPFLAGLGGLAKPTGYFIMPLALFFALSHKYFKSSIYLILVTLIFVGLFIWYGMHFDAEVFWRIVSIQGMRPAGFSSLGWFFTSPAFDITTLTDSWFIFTLLSAAFFLFNPLEGTKKIISFAFVYWIIIVMLSGGQSDLLPWYRFPSYPLLAILGAFGLQAIIKRADFYASFLVVGLLLGSRFLLVNAFRPDVSPLEYRLIFSGLMAPSLLGMIFNKELFVRLTRLILIVIVIVGIYFNVIYIYNQFELNCESKSCPIGPSTPLSTLHIPIFWKWMVLGEPTLK